MYDYRSPAQLKVVFNWILDLVLSAAGFGPGVGPTNPGKEQDGELRDFGNQVFLRLLSLGWA